MSAKRRNTWIAAGLVLIVLAVFWQVRGHDFVSFDDGRYITENPHIRQGLTWDGIAWAFSTTYANFWHPLTWLSHMLDWQLYGANPAGHHLTNIFLHALNAVLLFFVLLRMTDRPWESALAAALFAIHPLHVESVAWASERKDVLSTLFWILTMGAYLLYVKNRRFSYYMLFLSAFLLGLMAKPMLVTLPFVLLLLDYWPLKRFRQINERERLGADGSRETAISRVPTSTLLLEKFPLLVCATGVSLLAYYAQHSGGATKPLALFPWESRVLNALWSYFWYIIKTVWPHHLAVFYPHAGKHLSWMHGGAAGVFLFAVTAWAVRRKESSPYFLVGWLWFLGTLVPVIGLVQVGDHGMADRYTYVPLIGLFFVFSWGISQVAAKALRNRMVLGTMASILIFSLAVCSWYQIGHWKNSVQLFQKALAVGPPSPLVYTDLGAAVAARGEIEKAIGYYQKALEIDPDYIGALVNLGSLLSHRGRLEEAISLYKRALRKHPDLAGAHFNMANALMRQDRLDTAISHYKKAIRHQPGEPEFENNLGIAFVRQGNLKEGIVHFQNAVHLDPNFVQARENLNTALLHNNSTS